MVLIEILMGEKLSYETRKGSWTGIEHCTAMTVSHGAGKKSAAPACVPAPLNASW